MGKLIINTYKNTFVTPDDTNGVLKVYMSGSALCESIFQMQALRATVDNIEIFAGQLSQKEFNEIIDIIKKTTVKTTDLTFFPVLNPNEELQNAYTRYEQGYREQNADNPKHFPDNIFINTSLVEIDEEKDNLIKPNIKKI